MIFEIVLLKSALLSTANEHLSAHIILANLGLFFIKDCSPKDQPVGISPTFTNGGIAAAINALGLAVTPQRTHQTSVSSFLASSAFS